MECAVSAQGCHLLTTLLDSYLPRVITWSSVLYDTFLFELVSLVPGGFLTHLANIVLALESIPFKEPTTKMFHGCVLCTPGVSGSMGLIKDSGSQTVTFTIPCQSVWVCIYHDCLLVGFFSQYLPFAPSEWGLWKTLALKCLYCLAQWIVQNTPDSYWANGFIGITG